jgi:hypothetical protein
MLVHLNSVSFWYLLTRELAAVILALFAYFATGRSILGAVAVCYFLTTAPSCSCTALQGNHLTLASTPIK